MKPAIFCTVEMVSISPRSADIRARMVEQMRQHLAEWELRRGVKLIGFDPEEAFS